MRNNADQILLCPNCRDLEFERGETTATECGCPTAYKDMFFCAMCALDSGRCRHCGADVSLVEEARHKVGVKKRRKRQLKAAIKEREKVKDAEEREQYLERRESGKRGGKFDRRQHQRHSH